MLATHIEFSILKDIGLSSWKIQPSFRISLYPEPCGSQETNFRETMLHSPSASLKHFNNNCNRSILLTHPLLDPFQTIEPSLQRHRLVQTSNPSHSFQDLLIPIRPQKIVLTLPLPHLLLLQPLHSLAQATNWAIAEKIEFCSLLRRPAR